MTDFTRYGLRPWGAAPNSRHMEWYRRGKTAFLHFTVNTFTDREWGDGRESPDIFAPTALDCRQWARILQEAGFTAAILTAKHHDGFCLWYSDYTRHSVQYSPCGVDVVKEFTDACREYGIKPGLYLSPWDRNHPQWGTEAYNDYYANQLTELMTRYGPLWECWWDGAGSTKAHYDWKRWADIVRQNQPQCVIFGCLGAAEYVDVRWVGNESGSAGDPCYGTIDPITIQQEVCEDLNRGKWGGSHFIPAETNTSIRPGWFYHAQQDNQVRTPENLVNYWFQSAGRNTAILLNLPPDRRGLIHETDAANVIRWNEMLREMFSEDLAQKARVFAAEPLHPDCGPENLTDPGDDRIYAARTLTPEITLAFDAPVTFDCYRLEEVIELGHRIREFSLDVREMGSWRSLLTREGIGFCRAERLEPITAEAIRIRVTAADAAPVLRRISLFHTRGIGLEQRKASQPEELTGLQPQADPHGVVIPLGGIYPFNQVRFPVEGSFTVQAFNGTRYETIWQGHSDTARFETVTGSYQLRILDPEGALQDPAQIRVFCR